MADSGRLEELQRKFDENPRRYFAPLANEYRKGGDAERAIELCRTYLPHLPGHMSGYIVYGQALFDVNRGHEAAAVFQEALRIDPENVIALRHLGDIARMEGERSFAIQWYEKVLELDPKNEEIAAYIAELAVADATDEYPVPGYETSGTDIGSGDRPPVSHEAVESVAAEEMAAEGGAPEESSPEPPPAEAAFEELTFQKYAPYEYPDLANPTSASAVEPNVVGEPSSEPDPLVVPESAPPVVSRDASWETPNEDVMIEPSSTAYGLDTPEEHVEPSIPFITETLANLYIEQGLFSEALIVYRQLAETRDDPAIHDRVRELEAKVAEVNAAEASVAAAGVSEERVRPAVTVRDFFARIGARRPHDDGVPPTDGGSPTDASPMIDAHSAEFGHESAGSGGLHQLFSSASVDDADVRAARSLADAYTRVPSSSDAAVRTYAPQA